MLRPSAPVENGGDVARQQSVPISLNSKKSAIYSDFESVPQITHKVQVALCLLHACTRYFSLTSLWTFAFRPPTPRGQNASSPLAGSMRTRRRTHVGPRGALAPAFAHYNPGAAKAATAPPPLRPGLCIGSANPDQGGARRPTPLQMKRLACRWQSSASRRSIKRCVSWARSIRPSVGASCGNSSCSSLNASSTANASS